MASCRGRLPALALTSGWWASKCCSVLLELCVCPMSPMSPRRQGKASGDTAGGLTKLSSPLMLAWGSPHLQCRQAQGVGFSGFRVQDSGSVAHTSNRQCCLLMPGTGACEPRAAPGMRCRACLPCPSLGLGCSMLVLWVTVSVLGIHRPGCRTCWQAARRGLCLRRGRRCSSCAMTTSGSLGRAGGLPVVVGRVGQQVGQFDVVKAAGRVAGIAVCLRVPAVKPLQ